jgi:hypothetical protein
MANPNSLKPFPAASPPPTSGFVSITPEWAARILSSNKQRNRGVSAARVDALVRDILADQWRVTGEPIILDAVGNILNGQHRLTAIVKSGRPVTTMLVTGIDAGVIDAIDTGRPRRTADILRIRGVNGTGLLVPRATVLLSLFNGATRHAIGTVSELERVISEHSVGLLWTSENLPEKRDLGIAGVGAAFALAYEVAPDATEAALGACREPAKMSPRDPALALLGFVRSNGSSNSKYERFQLACRALNAVLFRMRGEERAILKFSEEGREFFIKAWATQNGVVGKSTP